MDTPTTIANNLTLSGQVTQDVIDTWKAKHKIDKIFTYVIEDKICYLRPVDRDIYGLAVKKMERDTTKFNETVINGIWLGGDEDIRKVNGYYFGLIEFVEELMAKKKGILSEI
ncbi:hypothetical protein SAMN05428988_1312 [Chitinophaga sp. YR573]|uniref:hypothetical protein n=1 Tax=Chitinophaga sp. YR573 TaxID=1881040 RepID=UPI0008C5B117|nr:hypothetical protein [Chitinophaga sp. YR573]SEW01920.1 hypothetical protein SAMN05428988_1312 [Chitinophaga sp. YR573]